MFVWMSNNIPDEAVRRKLLLWDFPRLKTSNDNNIEAVLPAAEKLCAQLENPEQHKRDIDLYTPNLRNVCRKMAEARLSVGLVAQVIEFGGQNPKAAQMLRNSVVGQN